MHHLLADIGIAVIAATLLGLIAHWLKQPILLGYLIAGAVVGPAMGFGWVKDGESIEIISEIGLILLLFIIGLELNLKQVLASGKLLLAAGFGQFPICVALGLGLAALLGLNLSGKHANGLYLALLCGLSSTAIVVKLLYDKGEFDTLPGRLTIGILVIQDIFAIFVLAFQPNFGNPALWPVVKAILNSIALVLGGLLVSRYVLKYIFASIARTPEMVLAVSGGWCAAVAAAAGAMGLSKEMGALIAGLSIAAYPYSIDVTAKTLPLRDFFLTLFFVSLGMKITPPTWSLIGPVLGIVAFVILSRFASIYPLIALTGGGRRAAFIVSLNLAQISEFSLVIASLGVTYGHIGKDVVAMVLYAMAITAVFSSYAIRLSHPLYLLFDRLMNRIRTARAIETAEAASAGRDVGVVLLGYHRGGRALVDALARQNPGLLKDMLIIDFNPLALDEARGRGIRALFGDISSMETLQHAHIGHARHIISTIPDLLLRGVDNLALVRMCRSIAPHAQLVATADDERHEQRLRAEGADLVLRPYEAASVELAKALAGEAPAAPATHA